MKLCPLVLCSAISVVSLAVAKPTITIGDKVFTLAHEEKTKEGPLREFLLPEESLQKWSRLVSVREFNSQKDPKQYIVSFAQRYRAQNPALKFMVSEDKATGGWLIDFLSISPDPQLRFIEWNVFRANKAKKGIVVYQYAARLYFKERILEVNDALAKLREEMVPIVYAADFQEKREPNKAPL